MRKINLLLRWLRRQVSVVLATELTNMLNEAVVPPHFQFKDGVQQTST
jgi:hypothetical protein